MRQSELHYLYIFDARGVSSYQFGCENDGNLTCTFGDATGIRFIRIAYIMTMIVVYRLAKKRTTAPVDFFPQNNLTSWLSVRRYSKNTRA